MSTAHLLPTFARVDLAFERGEGAWLTATNGERYLDFTSGVAVNALGHAHPKVAEAIASQAHKAIHVSNLFRVPEQEKARRPAVRGELRRLCVLLQFGRRGDGRRDQDRAQVPRRERQARALSHRHVRGRVPRPHARDARGRRPEEISRRLRSGGRRLRPGAVRRSRSGEESHHARRPPRSWSSRSRAKAASAFRPMHSSNRCARCATSTACC